MDEWMLAADRHGIVSAEDLRRAGLGAAQIARLVAAHLLTPLVRGWYALGRPTNSEQHHLLTTRALLRAYDGRALAAGHSALLLLGLSTYRADLTRVRLSRRTPGPTRSRPTHSLGRVVPVDAQRGDTVAPALAVVQHGLSAGPLSALVAADSALNRRMVGPDDLRDALVWTRFHPHSAAVTRLLALADGRRESPGETRLAHALHLSGVAATPQAPITAPGFTAYVDLLLTDEKVVLEFDGRIKYGRTADEPDPYGNRRSPGQVVWAEKQREDRLRELGYEVVRVTWADMDDPVALAARIGAAVRRARARRLGTGVDSPMAGSAHRAR